MFLKGWFFQVSIFIHNYNSFICFHFHFPYENESLWIWESNHHHHFLRENQALEKGERTLNYTLFTIKFRWQLCEMIVNSCWYVLAWFSIQHLPSLHNAACSVSNFGVLKLQQKYNSYNSFRNVVRKKQDLPKVRWCRYFSPRNGCF